MFLTIKDWVDTVVHPNDEVILREYHGIYGYCRCKYEIAKRIQPKVIVEIGVRLGYSAHAFLSAVPDAVYHGLDVWGGEHGGTNVAGADYVQSMLERHFREAEVVLHTCDTQTMVWPILPFPDLFHVDGDHTTEGALRDLQNAYELIAPGKAILVDDYDFIPDVKIAVEKFKTMVNLQYSEHIPSFRGDVLLIKGAE
jgi:hypothetical protein